MFQPQSDIIIGSVPWDDSYINVLWTDISQRDNAAVILGIMGENTTVVRRQDYTYVRADSAIRVPVNAEKLYNYNYVMYKNSNYGDMWFYAFVTNVKYINENCTELQLEEDVFQTWARGALDVSRDTFVQRCHVNDDTIGRHTLPEPDFGIEHEAIKSMAFSTLQEVKYKLIIQTTTVPKDVAGVKELGYSFIPITVGGAKYNGVFTGARYYAFDMDSSFDSDLSTWTRALTLSGGSGAVTNMFMFPEPYLPGIGDTSIYYTGIAENAAAHAVTPDDDDSGEEHLKHYDINVPRPSTIRGYTPRNNKCLTYPYTFIRLEAPGKGHNDYRYEWFSDIDSVAFRTYMPMDADTQFIAAPIAYGIDSTHGRNYINYAEAFFANMTNRVSWTTSSYADWSAQNSLGLLLNAGMCVAGMVPQIRAVATAGQAAASTMNATRTAKGLPAMSARQTSRFAWQTAANYVGEDAYDDFKRGARGLSNMGADVSRAQHIPDKQCGSSSGNALFAIGAQKPIIRIMAPRAEYIEIVDRYFDMYGYSVELFTTPHVTGRPVWNYVKTAGFQARPVQGGTLPLDAQRTIEQVFDRGVTFWHVDTAAAFGDYTQDNAPAEGHSD